MLVSGLWHGANWTFVIWGGGLGLALVVERLLGLARPNRPAVLVLAWFALVQFTWILSMGLFRSENLNQGLNMIVNALHGLGSLFSPGSIAEPTHSMVILGWYFTLPVLLIHGRSWVAERTSLGPVSRSERAVYAGMMLAALLMLYSSSQQFIYFQF
jgi:alginate O-acetyltransferase complex protein AlgI